ncbi:hypothetical protein HPB48_013895 [Haemaphysalis longicornis]|uniref:CCHC-type domain-containing protein n=1 Tax=Haemaphysalis longicornis TaxID=44386 RepID=A0A9J6G301_HAELO|nr:hypothetical protein HPB48_013895 [Haemaphysalis longicornis]
MRGRLVASRSRLDRPLWMSAADSASDKVKRRILAKKEVSLACAVEEATAAEAIDREASQSRLNATATRTEPVHQGTVGDCEEDQDGLEECVRQLRADTSQRRDAGLGGGACAGCGGPHERRLCRFRDAQCRGCGKTGHIAKVCQSQRKRDHRANFEANGRTYNSRATPRASTSYCDNLTETAIHDVPQPVTKKIHVVVEIESVECEMELDSRYTFSLISEATARQIFPNGRIPKLKQLDIVMKDYQGNCIAVQVMATVMRQDGCVASGVGVARSRSLQTGIAISNKEQANQAQKQRQEDSDLSIVSKHDRHQTVHELKKAREMELGMNLGKHGESKTSVEEQQNQLGDGQLAGDARSSQEPKPHKSEEERQRKRDARESVHAMQKTYELEQAGLLRLQKGNLIQEAYQSQPVMDVRMLHETQPGGDGLQQAYENAQRDQLRRSTYGSELPQPQNQQDLQTEIDRYQRAQTLESLYEQEQRGTLARMRKRGLQDTDAPQQQIMQPLTQGELKKERKRYQRAQEMEKAYEKEQHDHLKRALQGNDPTHDRLPPHFLQEQQAKRERDQTQPTLEKLPQKEQHVILNKISPGEAVQQLHVQPYLQAHRVVQNEHQLGQPIDKGSRKEDEDNQGKMPQETCQRTQQQLQEAEHQKGKKTDLLEVVYEIERGGKRKTPRGHQPILNHKKQPVTEKQEVQLQAELKGEKPELLQKDILRREHKETQQPQKEQGLVDQKPKSDGLLHIFEGAKQRKIQPHGIQNQLEFHRERIFHNQPGTNQAHEVKEYKCTGGATSDETPKLGPSAAKPTFTLSPANHGLAGSQMKVKTKFTVESLPQSTNGNECVEDTGRVASITGRVSDSNGIGVHVSWAPGTNNTVSSTRTETASYTDEVQEEARLTDVLRRLSTALDFSGANFRARRQGKGH